MESHRPGGGWKGWPTICGLILNEIERFSVRIATGRGLTDEADVGNNRGTLLTLRCDLRDGALLARGDA